jgi:hypothetical protein
MKESLQTRSLEPRWLVILAVLVVLILLAALPASVRVLPSWAFIAVSIVVIAPMAGVGLTRADLRWVRIERTVTLVFSVLIGLSTVMSLGFVIRAMVRESAAATGGQLLIAGTKVWATNVLVFSLLYWQLDRGGPDGRANQAGVLPDWQFPQTSAPDDVPPGWRPTFIDYLALGLTTAMAFSPTDVLPLTSRAKVLMMLESLISLVTVVVVGSRAINILGS